jgi:hypothetical protein
MEPVVLVVDDNFGQCGDKLFGRYLVIEETRFRSRPLLRSVRGSRQ